MVVMDEIDTCINTAACHQQCPGLLDTINFSFVYILPSGMTWGLVRRRVLGKPDIRINKEVSPANSIPDC